MCAKKRRKKSARAEPEPAAEEQKEDFSADPAEETTDETDVPEEEPDSIATPETAEEDVKEPETPAPDPGEIPKRVVRCPVCGGSGEDHAKQEDIFVCKCEDCGLLFQNPRPSVGYLAGLRDRRFEGVMLKPHGREIREQSEIAREIMKGYHHRTSGRPAVLNAFGKHVFEVNCGLGIRLREFQRYGWTIDGIDTSRNAVEYAKGCSLDVELLWLDTATFRVHTFDLILFWDNFCGLADPVHAVEMCAFILKPEGLVYVHIPVVDKETFNEEILFYFDPDSLRRVFMQNGFTVSLENHDESGYFFWFRKKERSVKNASEES